MSDAEGGVLGWQPDANQRAWIMAEATRLGVTSAEVLDEALSFYRACIAVQRETGDGPITITGLDGGHDAGRSAPGS